AGLGHLPDRARVDAAIGQFLAGRATSDITSCMPFSVPGGDGFVPTPMVTEQAEPGDVICTTRRSASTLLVDVDDEAHLLAVELLRPLHVAQAGSGRGVRQVEEDVGAGGRFWRSGRVGRSIQRWMATLLAGCPRPV
ncbi:MAG: hypothetical protein JWP62_2188, partial [Blastococcus sp.]|nr:hypothetical protein [Blastococcus sp.]